MGGKTNTSTNQIKLPSYLSKAYKGLINMGQDVANQPYQEYGAPRVAGFTPDQTGAFNMTENAQGMGTPFINAAAGNYDTAGSTFGGALDTVNEASQWINPAGNTFNAALGGLGEAYQGIFPQVEKYDASTLQKYMDPYQQQVIDTSMANMQHQNAVQQQQLRSQGLGAGVSPNLGDRAGLAQAELARGQSANVDQTIAQLFSQGFGNAQTALQGQQNLQLQGLTADQQRKLQAAQAAAGIGGQFGQLATTQAGLGQAAAGIGAQQQGLGTAQANLGQTAQNMTYQGIQQLLANGLQQQGLGQLGLDQAYQQFQDQRDYPKNQTDWLANLIYGSPGKGATTSTATTPAPSIFSQLVGLGTAGLGLATRAEGGAVTLPHFDIGGVPTPRLDPAAFAFPQGAGFGAPTAMDPGSTAGYFNPLPQLGRPFWKPMVTTHNMPQSWRHDVKHFPLPGKGDNANIQGGGGGGGGNSGSGGGGGGGGGGKVPSGDYPWLVQNRARGGMVPHFDIGGATEFDPNRFRDPVDPISPSAPVTWAPNPAAPPAEAARVDDYPVDAGVDSGTLPADYPDPSAVPHQKPRVWDTLKGMPLVEMGLGMMASSSPNPLQAIGEGGLKGLDAALNLDAHPVVDDSGPTIRIWIPSEHRWEDTHIPSNSYLNSQRYAANAGLNQYGMSPVPYRVKKTGDLIVGQLGNRGDVKFPTNPDTGKPYKDTEVEYAPEELSAARGAGAAAGKVLNPAAIGKEGQAINVATQHANLINSQLDQAINMVKTGLMNTGFPGAILSNVPGGPAYALHVLLLSIRAKITFATLAEMRASSTTGGALGQISNYEDQLLGNSIAAIDQAQDWQSLVQGLETVKSQMVQSLGNLHNAYQQDLTTSEGLGLAAPAGAPAPGALPPVPSAVAPAPAGRVYDPKTGTFSSGTAP